MSKPSSEFHQASAPRGEPAGAHLLKEATAPVVPLKDRLFAHLAVVDGRLSVSKARRALEKLVSQRLSGERTESRPSARRILVEAGALTPGQAHEIRRVREGLLLECWSCNTLYWLEPFDPLYSHRCKRCGDDLAWPSRPPAPSLSDSAKRSAGDTTIDEQEARRDSNASDTGDVSEMLQKRSSSKTFRPPSVSQVARTYAESALGEKEEHAFRLELELIGRRMGSFLVRKLIGRGGMGSVYEGYDPASQQIAAIKVMLPMTASAVDYVWRFKREAELSSKLRHPNLVEVWEFGEFGPWLYLTMPFVEGKTLQQILHERGKPLPIERTVHHIADALEGVHAAHETGILHRDLKPDNLLVTPQGRVRVLDFGLARAQLDDRITQVGQTVGTPRFMSPEQWRDQSVGPQADVHSLGISLYYLLCGDFPYPDAETPLGAYHSMMDNMPVPLGKLRPEVSAELERAVHRMIAKDPRRRPATAHEAAEALRSVVPPLEALPDEPLMGASSDFETQLGTQKRRRKTTRRVTPATPKDSSRRDERETPAIAAAQTAPKQPLHATHTPANEAAAAMAAQRQPPGWRSKRWVVWGVAGLLLVLLALIVLLGSTLFGNRTENGQETGSTSFEGATEEKAAKPPIALAGISDEIAAQTIEEYAKRGDGRVESLDRGRIRVRGPLLVLPEPAVTGKGELLLRVRTYEVAETAASLRIGMLAAEQAPPSPGELPAFEVALAAAPLEAQRESYLAWTHTGQRIYLTQAATRDALARTAPLASTARQASEVGSVHQRLAIKIPSGFSVEISQATFFPAATAQN